MPALTALLHERPAYQWGEAEEAEAIVAYLADVLVNVLSSFHFTTEQLRALYDMP